METERQLFNRRTARVGGLVLTLMHACYLAIYSSMSSWDGPGSAKEQWRTHLQWIHGAMLPLVLGFVALSFGRPRRWLGEAMTAAYLAYGVLVSINTQLIASHVDVYAVVVVSLAFALRLSLVHWTMLVVLALGCLLLGVHHVQPDPTVRLSILNNALPLTAVAWVFSRQQFASMVRDVRQRTLLEEQRDALAELSERLDRQLREKLIERSRELRAAIERLGRPQRPSVLQPGTVLRERFAIEQLLGEGGMGTVYAAHDRLLGRACAVKVVAIVHDELALKRFLREVEAMAEVKHPAVVRPLYVDLTDDGQLFHVQELVLGESLEHVQRRVRTLPAHHVARLGAQLADALAGAHSRGIVHRDVKPSNVLLLESQPGLKLLDFGISKLRGSDGDTTSAGVVIGTPSFMAPEQLAWEGEVSGAVDMFALGVSLHLVLRGALPSRGGPRADESASVLDSVLWQCLAEAPAERPCAAAVRDRLAAYADELGAPDLSVLNQVLGLRGGELGSEEPTV